MPVLVYLITGFLDSGKTTLIKESLEDPEFTADNNKTLIIHLEEGEETLSDEWLKKHNASSVYLELEELTHDKMTSLNNTYHPQQVFIEYNGLKSVESFLESKMIKGWILVQILTTIDATTFISYMNNLKSYMYEIIRFTQTIIFNRLDKNISKQVLRNNVKAVNQNVQIIYINKENQIEKYDITNLPFNINSDIIIINDDDYGLWYMDAIENIEKYNGKQILLRGKYLEKLEKLNHSFILGRYAMVCCADDMQPIAITVTGVNVTEMKLNDWYQVEGTLRSVDRGDGSKTLVLYAAKISAIPPLLNELVNFN